MISIIVLTLNNNAVTFYLNILCIGNYWNIQMLRNLWSYLSGITINSLTTCDDQIIINVSKSTCDRCRSSPSISTTKYTICYQNTVICAHSHCFTKNFLSLWKTHGQYSNLCSCFIFNSKCCFQTCFIIRVHDGKHCTSVQCTIWIKLYSAFGIWNLLYTYYNFHGNVTPCLI